jgi:hypothetical protein
VSEENEKKIRRVRRRSEEEVGEKKHKEAINITAGRTPGSVPSMKFEVCQPSEVKRKE